MWSFWWYYLWSTHNPCWYTYSALWMQNGSLQWVLSKVHLQTRGPYCISTLSTANVVVVLSWVVVPTVSFRFLLCVLYHVWHWLGCAFSFFVWLFEHCALVWLNIFVSFSLLIYGWKICFFLIIYALVQMLHKAYWLIIPAELLVDSNCLSVWYLVPWINHVHPVYIFGSLVLTTVDL